MLKNGVNKIIFSSTCAVYGIPQSLPLKESHPTVPVNPYGESKLMCEKIMYWYEYSYGLKYISLRYFNAAGAYKGVGEAHSPETHLIPIVLEVALGRRDYVEIFGTDYETKDGTCIRDYIHVKDIALAHLLAMEMVEKKSGIYNIGNGEGFSVKTVISVASRVTNKKINYQESNRRPGDPPTLIADNSKFEAETGWSPEIQDLEIIIKDAWTWHKNPSYTS
jgi:UDP-glucose 4-epimerase